MTESQDFDVMVSHDPIDKAIVTRLKNILKESGLKVWTPSSPNDDRGQAVVNCKVFVQVLSETAAKSRFCQDELSLAYVSNTPIFPVGLDEFSKVAAHLDAGRKLMLAKINWTFIKEEEDFSTNLPELISCINDTITGHQKDTTDSPNDKDEELDEMFFTMNSATSRIMNSIRRSSQTTPDFWDQNFQSENITWLEFEKCFVDEYKELIVNEFGEDKEKGLINLVHRDIFNKTTQLKREEYSKFCGPNIHNEPDLFFSRVKDYAVSIAAMKEVFDMDSTVRLTAVQQLGAYRTQAVLSILLDLMHDEDPNMRVVAVLALGRSGRATKRLIDALLDALEDDDRLVRESVCLSLGHLKAKRAIHPILDVWRNDPIRNVREAANIALDKIGGEEVNDAMKVTKVLSEEMANLRKKKP